LASRPSLGRIAVVPPYGLQPREILGGRNHDVPVTVTRDAGAPADHPLGAVRLDHRNRGNDSERREQIRHAARDLSRRSRKGHAVTTSGSIAEEIAPQERHAERLGDVEYQVRNSLGGREDPEESEYVLPDERSHTVDELQIPGEALRLI